MSYIVWSSCPNFTLKAIVITLGPCQNGVHICDVSSTPGLQRVWRWLWGRRNGSWCCRSSSSTGHIQCRSNPSSNYNKNYLFSFYWKVVSAKIEVYARKNVVLVHVNMWTYYINTRFTIQSFSNSADFK